jgi:hypothetical protein
MRIYSMMDVQDREWSKINFLKKMKKIITIGLILMIIIGCGKKATVHIKAINAVTGEPYAGLAYGITATKTVSNGEKKVFEVTGFLDANGEAYVPIRVKTGRTYNVGTAKPPNYCYDKQPSYSFGKEDIPNLDFQFEYAACANLKLEINNINCQGPTDEIKFRRLWLHQNATNNFVTQTGCFSFTGEFFQLPIGNYKYEWEVTRNGLTTYHDSLFTLTENQFYTFVLNY